MKKKGGRAGRERERETERGKEEREREERGQEREENLTFWKKKQKRLAAMSSSFFRVSLGTKHPYSPESAHLPGYEPARLNFGVVLAVFFGVTALVGAGTWSQTAGESTER